MSSFVSVVHAMGDRTIEIRWGFDPEGLRYWDQIKLSTEKANEKQIKKLIAKMDRNGAPIGLKCYVIHFVDQSIECQKEWDRQE